MRESGSEDNDLLVRLANDTRIPMDSEALSAAIGDPNLFIGNAYSSEKSRRQNRRDFEAISRCFLLSTRKHSLRFK